MEYDQPARGAVDVAMSKTTSSAPSRSQVLLARLVVALVLGFSIVGLVMNGISAEVISRVWQNLVERPDGPLVFRFVLQPVMALIAAVRDGLNDARTGRDPFLRTVLTEPAKRAGRLDEALVATSRIILLGLVMDAIYQFIEFDTFRPGEAVIIALLLAFVPYLLFRGVVTRVARRWFADRLTRDIR
jgi:hypothetical protein